jgi:hypothetical protein
MEPINSGVGAQRVPAADSSLSGTPRTVRRLIRGISARDLLRCGVWLELTAFSDRLRRPDNLLARGELAPAKIHGFASLLHNRFAIIGAIVSNKDHLPPVRAGTSIKHIRRFLVNAYF